MEESLARDFIRAIIEEDLKNKTHEEIITRFPPEPNGYLHIGHAKSICLNFGIARDYNGRCHLRFDDTDPSKEEIEYIESIKEDVKWLGFDWGDHLYYASDYFEKMYEYAVLLITGNKAYVDDLSPEQIREYRGTLTRTGKESPYRNRPASENLDLFRRMKDGEFDDGACVLRAKIDMSSPNMNMRDPTLYRIKKVPHHRTKDRWCIYPMYDFAHCLSDAMEGITHSICTLEFEDHRPLYDWILDQLPVPCHPRQIEFARLNVSHTIMSKRKLGLLVEKKAVSGWDDPRMPTISGLRRRGFTPEAIRTFCDRIGVAKTNSVVDLALLEHYIREDLNKRAPRMMAVLSPLKVVIDNYQEDKVEWLDAENNPEDPAMGSRKLPFTRELFIERDDFMEDPPPKYFRLAPGREIRLKHAYYIRCETVEKDPKTGEAVEIHCTYDEKTRGGWSEDGRKVRGTSHWVSAPHALRAEVRLYDHLFCVPNPAEEKDIVQSVDPESLTVLDGCLVEPGLADAKPGDTCQFLRQGYFSVDADSKAGVKKRLVFNRTATLRDTWAKIQKKQ
ncbi:MAG: glutamine--tRNA ligase/YqeY domain fusion protein [Spirochaetes bacterium]|nr:glutamine--tRNA ligase/YqeY domain fusion protein [Spirochaetota bacterium]